MRIRKPDGTKETPEEAYARQYRDDPKFRAREDAKQHKREHRFDKLDEVRENIEGKTEAMRQDMERRKADPHPKSIQAWLNRRKNRG
ncbi:hypothetical protein [Rhodococcus koreensis]